MNARKSPETPWQPIETAPKDGRRVLVANDYDMAVCRWDYSSLFDHEPKHWIYGQAQGEYNVYQELDSPTHWMPAPPLPERD